MLDFFKRSMSPSGLNSVSKPPTRWHGPEVNTHSGCGVAPRESIRMSYPDPVQVPVNGYHPSAG